ncbi:calcium-binding protein [Flavimaricola marinus]|uniref:Calcium-binding protein n=1 Tax=Flavimaricola marinus TaxID=1819565 RepID=A0A238LBA6_9RHOB|nr:calcium-binding protein [Flavimaricola marinus]SMY06891.1 hypothetical protein LOM8899_01021 [Flavimaricola marinus]
MWFRACLVVLLMLPGMASAQKDLRVFVFGNSLIHHLTESDETAMPHWLALMARAGGHGLQLDGRWGFLRNFARDLPPEPNWSFAEVERTGLSDRVGFRRVGFDTIIINPANFIQGDPPDAPYNGDNPNDDTPLAATLRLLDWTENQADGARFYIYEGWAFMGSITRYPPSNRGYRRYQAHNAGEYHVWYEGYVADLQAARPDLSVTLIPVASVLAEILTGVLADLDPEEVYSDDAPHGTANTYFLAGLVTYSALFAEPAPLDMPLPDTLSPLIRERYPQIVADIWAALGGAVIPDEAQLIVPETGLADPSLALGLSGIADWSTQVPFIDQMKSARPWVGHEPGQWGAWDIARLEAGGYLGPDGWPLALPDGVEALEAFVLTDQPAEFTSIAGRYIVRWRGEGDFEVGGIARDIERIGSHELAFSYVPGDGLVSMRINATDPGDPIRDIVVIREDHLPLYEVGATFNPDWIARIRDARMVRFMDWMFTNGSTQETWAGRPKPGDFSYHWRGAPVEVMVELANQIGADPWFTLPHRADDAYVRAFAGYVHTHLDPRLHVYAEWSNEVWNFIFPQGVWAREQAEARWGNAAEQDGWMQFAGLRAAEVAQIWAQEYGADRDRLVRVVSTHTGWPGLEEALLTAPLAQAEGLPAPVESFDAYAVTGYFGFEMGEEANAGRLRAWLANGTAIENTVKALYDGSLGQLIDEVWPYHAEVAERYGLELLMYEGGTHVTGHGAHVDDPDLTAFYTAFNYSPEIAAIYADLLTAWRSLGGQAFNAFVDVAAPSRWGSWGALRHLDDMNPRWQTLMAFNSLPLEANRDPTAFLHGVLRQGSEAADQIEGTPQSDILIGGPGDDLLLARGGADRIHGGEGVDRAVLPGADADYSLAWDGAALVLFGPLGNVRLVAVEELQFETDPATVLSLDLPEPQL